MARCQQFLEELNIPMKHLDPSLDECFCSVCCPDLPDMLDVGVADGSRAYQAPKGYCAFGLQAPRQAKNEDMSSWVYSYCGCFGSGNMLLTMITEGQVPNSAGDGLRGGRQAGQAVGAARCDTALEDRVGIPSAEGDSEICTSGCLYYSELDVFTRPSRWRETCTVRIVIQCKQKPDFTVRAETVGWAEQFGSTPISPHCR